MKGNRVPKPKAVPERRKALPRIQIYCDRTSDLALVNKAARLMRLSISAFARQTVIREAERVISHHHQAGL